MWEILTNYIIWIDMTGPLVDVYHMVEHIITLPVSDSWWRHGHEPHMPCLPDTAAQVRDHNYAVNKRQNFSSYDIRRKPFRLCNISQYSALREPPGAEKPLGDVFR